MMPFKFLLRTCSFFLTFWLLKTTATCLTNSLIEVGLSCRLPVRRTHEHSRTGVTRRHSPAWQQNQRNLTTLLLAFHVLRNLEATHTHTHTPTHTHTHTHTHTYSPLPRYGDLVSTPRSGDPGLQGIFSNNMHGVWSHLLTVFYALHKISKILIFALWGHVIHTLWGP